MADEKLNTGPGEQNTPPAPDPVTVEQPQASAPEQAAVPQPEQSGPAQPEAGDVVVSFDKINELMAEKREAARAEVEKAAESQEKEAGTEKTEQPAAGEAEPKKPRRGRPPKEEKPEAADREAVKPRKGRPPKADKAAPGEAKPPKRDKLSRSGKSPDAKLPPDPGKAAPVKESAPPEQAAQEPTVQEPTAPPRPVEEGKLVYLKLSEMHPFHTFRPHPFKVRDDAKMQETVASIKANGVMVPGLARPEKDGNGYEIVAGHRRHRGSELAGLGNALYCPGYDRPRGGTGHEGQQ